VGQPAPDAVTHVFRYFVAQPLAERHEVRLTDEDAHHLARVVRRRRGDVVDLVDSAGRVFTARVEDPGRALLTVIDGGRPAPAPAPLTLYLGLLEWSRLDPTYAQLAELGVAEVVLFASERAGRRPGEAEWRKRQGRMERVAGSAARQSGAGRVPTLRGIVDFDAVLAELAPGRSVMLDPRADRALMAALDGLEGHVALLVGPEAGFSAAERAAAEAAGVTTASLGTAVLRTGTAALAASAIGVGALHARGTR
jgi:16S rRNA (uracil1498-N3)-methyltransferase